MKKKSCILKAAVFAALCFVQGVWAQVWNGTIDAEWYWDNTSQTEFTITKAEQLAGLAQLVNGGNNFSGKTIKLGANIMLNDTANWRTWSKTKPTNIWTPVGSYKDEKNNIPFSGTFDGGGYVVSGLYVSNSNNYQGLFGYANSGATIKNLGVAESYVNGMNAKGSISGLVGVGGLVGINGGTITNSYTKGNVAGSSNVGGLVGSNSGAITNSYATGDVKGSKTVGSLVGSNSGTITNSYATGNVTGGYVGGLVGSNSGTITDCYATGNVGGHISSTDGYAGGLVGSNSGTIMDCYATGNVQGYIVGGLVGSNNVGFLSNKGGTITNCYAMGNVRGGDNSIVGGLVGSNSSTITNCHATGDVQGNTVGGLVGSTNGTITNCYAMGNVKGRNDVGGLAGKNSSTITNCYATGNVTGSSNVGGLMGRNEGSTIKDCYAMGNVVGSSKVGGLMGRNEGKITNCYSAGKVTGTTGNTIGGLMGTNEGSINNSYYDRQVSGQVDINKGEPKSTVQMKQQETYANWDFDNIWRVNADKHNGYPYLQFIESKTDTIKYKYPRKITQEGIVLTDKRDNKKYKTVIIGTQTWMAENLNYNAKGSKCYDNKSENCKKYGMLYNWATALKACPSDWHLPTNAEWDELHNYADLYASNEAAMYLKAANGWNNWYSPYGGNGSGNGTDDFGFSALPGGYGNSDGSFNNVGGSGNWWSANEYEYYSYSACPRGTTCTISSASWHGNSKNALLNVRCLQD
jgi:uncharacterized protein (TIGR02145 family)